MEDQSQMVICCTLSVSCCFFIFSNRFLVEKGVIIFFLPRLITYCYSYRASSTSLCLSSVTYPPDKSGGKNVGKERNSVRVSQFVRTMTSIIKKIFLVKLNSMLNKQRPQFIFKACDPMVLFLILYIVYYHRFVFVAI